MRWFYKVPGLRGYNLANVALSKRAQTKAKKLSITDKEISLVFRHGSTSYRSGVLILEYAGVRLEIFRPRGRCIDLVTTIHRTKINTLWDHLTQDA
jgi:hypothetical protein